MTLFRSGAVLHQINRLIDPHAPDNLSDRELLECFLRQRDEAAFTVLLRRHGPMVMRVCRRVLNDWHAAEDAFQATFLVLARKAGSIRRREGVGGWLHGVAYRLALKARREARRPLPETAFAPTASPAPLDQLTMHEAQAMLDEEIQQLPAKYREPLLLCYLEEKTRDEAARQLGWPLGTLKSRVERGRELLRVGLERRGLTLSAGLVATTLAPRTATAALAAEMLRQTAQAAVQFAAGPLRAVAGISPEAVALAKGVLPMITLTQIKWAAVALLALALVGNGWGLIFHQTPLAQKSPTAEARPTTAADSASPSAKGPAGRDVYGDPLPPDSLTRLGTVRWRQEDDVSFLTYLPDGRHLLTRGRNGLFHLWDRQTGQVVRRFGKAQKEDAPLSKIGSGKNADAMMMSLGGVSEEAFTWPGAVALAPDGRRLAAADPDGVIVLWDLATGKELRHWKASSSGLLQMVPGVGANQITELLFAPDGRRLAAKVADGSLQVWDAAEGRELRKLRGSTLLGGILDRFFRPGFKDSLAFSADGKTLISAQPGFGFQKTGQPELTLTVNRWDLETGKELGPPKKFSDLALFGAFSPDGKTLAIAALQGALALWDVAENKEVGRINLGGGVVEFTSQVTFSPDGRFLAVKKGSRPIGLWDVASGKEVRHFGDPAQEGSVMGLFRSTFDLVGSRLVFSPDGSRLAVSENGRTIRQWDVGNGKDLDGFAGHRSPVEAVALAADGRTLWSRGSDGRVIQWDARGQVLRQIEGAAVTQGVVSADGRTLLLGFSDGTLAVHEARTGQETRRWKAHTPISIGGGILSIPPLLTVALAPDGKTAATWGSDLTIRLWDVATGRKLQEVPAKVVDAEGLPAEIAGLLATAITTFIPSTQLIFSPDGSQLAVLPPQFAGIADIAGAIQGQLGNARNKRSSQAERPVITLWDLATGRPVRRFESAPDGLLTGAFSPDGRTLATGQADGTILLWETASGKRRGQLQAAKENPVRALRFTPDGRTLISAGHDGTIRFWDWDRGEERRRLTGHRGGILSLAVAADGKTLVSGSEDTTALVWPVPTFGNDHPAQAVALEARQTEDLWGDLAGTDALKAFQAIRTLRAAPGSTLPWLRERLHPVSSPDPAMLARRIAELDSDQFDVRKQAEEDLKKLGSLAHPALRRTLANRPSLQVQQRIEKLLEKQVTGQPLTSEELRGLRAVEVLEQIGTPEARQVLEQLGQGAEGALLTREAKAAWQRLTP
jgi:RNA polymerase sigma factor (sigma-70 family)